jgi:hypothetical protein
MEDEPSIACNHLSTDPDLLMENAPEKDYAKELRMTPKRPQEQIAYTPFEKFIAQEEKNKDICTQTDQL